jgi:hypothetical protein
VHCTARGAIAVADQGDDRKDKLEWKWSKGSAEFADFGDPRTDDSYGLCIYDTTAGVPSLVVEIGVPASAVNWVRRGGEKGYRYRDPTGSVAGITSILLTAGAPGRAKMRVKAVGVATPLPGPVGGLYFNQDPKLTVQLSNESGQCWGSEFTSAPRDNDAGGFRAKLP